MKYKTFQPFLLHKHSVISCAIAKGWALRERGMCVPPGGSISIVGNGIAYNVSSIYCGLGFLKMQTVHR